MHYQAQHHPRPSPGGGHPYPRDPTTVAGSGPGGPGPSSSTHFVGGSSMMSPQNSYPSHPRQVAGATTVSVSHSIDYAPVAPTSYGVTAPYDIPVNYSNESTTRNYTDSQLGVAGLGGGVAVQHLNNSSSSHPNMTKLVAQQAPSTPGPPPPDPPYTRPSPSSSSQQSHHHHPQQQQPLAQQPYSTPRMPRHATVLKDRGSTENSVVLSDPLGMGSDEMGYGYSGGHPRGRYNVKTSPPSLKGRGGGSFGKNLNKAADKQAPMARTPQTKEVRSTADGRRTPERDYDNLEGQNLFATPNQRRKVPASTPTSYSEPPRSRTGNHRPHHHHQNMSPNYNRMRSPEHHAGNYSKGNGGGAGGGGPGYYNKSHQLNNKHQSKLPHGLTVQELKEMTRARLAAEAEIGGPEGNGSSDQSVHSLGTQSSSKGSADQFSVQGRSSSNDSSATAVTRNLVRDNESIRQRDYANQGGRNPNPQGYAQSQQQLQHLQQMQMQQNLTLPPYNNYSRHASPPFGPGHPPPPNRFNNGNNSQHPQGPPPRQTSPPVFALSSSMTRSQGEAWETASAASSDYPESGFRNNGCGMPFSSPMSDSNAMRFNRGRCFSAGATAGIPSSSFEQQHQPMPYYDTVPLSTSAVTGNRERCATVSPPGMSRLHEDRPFLFSTDDKQRLAIPPLSEPRLRLHSTGGLNTHMGGSAAMRGFHQGGNNNSAFEPIAGKASENNNERFLLHNPPSLTVDRAKFNVNDRTISTGSAASGHGDLPSSMAEAVLSSITSTSGPPIGGKVIGHASPFRRSMTEREVVLDNSPFRVGMSESSENTSSAFRMDTLLPESSGSMSLFSSGESGGRNLFSSEIPDRMLLGTHSWGGTGEGLDATPHSDMGISHDFSNLLNLSNGPALRGRAATEPAWFGGIDPFLVSRIDPEHNGGEEITNSRPPRVSSLVDTNNAPTNFNAHGQQQNMSFDGRFQ
mmetsp:Transcript_13862/g.26426  ORF Transcript_13862/g.26426 Transcript_13862/m.26426 type:complete len:963 (+) Transcript_13862:1222-4110(+)|eukprot:CAMPEP_0201683080 /NCGR_PEP_ID=MMETSP0494-20130426/51945_1 /ASSEMBLY_ACC=CAM_ASM_000839 /TAXON_ID=420259 /ORGANISM="Thalassiosira gravida, Strain GMp14c1" /LENGTH=962 /DNA_ID=CAMNT_0048166849 /DNA_START=415 /DNA_END=3303 /DNA_ORIENTATION=+